MNNLNKIINTLKGKKDISQDVKDVFIELKEELKGEKGKDGENYILTDKDKKEIAKEIEVPIVEKVIEKRIVKEKPIYNTTNEIKEVALYETPNQIVDKINTLEDVIEPKTIKGLTDFTVDLVKKNNVTITYPKKGFQDQRWHGAGITKVEHDTSLTGDGTIDSPLSASGIAENYKSKVSSADTKPGYLEDKILAGKNVTVTKENTGANEDLKIAVDLSGYVPITRKVNGKSLSSDITLVMDSSDFTLSNNTVNNVSTANHGFTPQLSNVSTQFLNGQGNWVTPAGIANAYISQNFTNQTSVTVSHAFGGYPAVQVIDTNGKVLVPLEITHTSTNAFTVTFDLSTSGNIIATLGSPQLNTYVSTGNDYTMDANDYLINETASGKSVTLLTAVGRSGKIIKIKNSSIGNITVIPAGAETIDRETTQVLGADDAIEIFSNGTNWLIT